MFSIIVPTYNRAPILQRALDQMLLMDGVSDCQFLLIDDGSTDETPRMLESFRHKHPDFNILRQNNAGPGAARNLGLAQAGHSRILFLDDDVFPCRELLSAHRQALESRADVSQGRLDWHQDIAGTEVLNFMDERDMQFAHSGCKHLQPLRYLQVYTANLATSKAVINQGGGFDSMLGVKRYAFEDTALAFRMEKAGARIVYNDQARALHLHPISREDLLAREYKVGYAAGAILEHYPEIAADMSLKKVLQCPSIQMILLNSLKALPVHKALDKKIAFRLQLRRSFIRGFLDFRRDNKEK